MRFHSWVPTSDKVAEYVVFCVFYIPQGKSSRKPQQWRPHALTLKSNFPVWETLNQVLREMYRIFKESQFSVTGRERMSKYLQTVASNCVVPPPGTSSTFRIPGYTALTVSRPLEEMFDDSFGLGEVLLAGYRDVQLLLSTLLCTVPLLLTAKEEELGRMTVSTLLY